VAPVINQAAPLGIRSGPKKTAKTFIKNLIKKHNNSFVGGSKLDSAKPKTAKPLKRDDGSDDANDEFEK